MRHALEVFAVVFAASAKLRAAVLCAFVLPAAITVIGAYVLTSIDLETPPLASASAAIQKMLAGVFLSAATVTFVQSQWQAAVEYSRTYARLFQ